MFVLIHSIIQAKTFVPDFPLRRGAINSNLRFFPWVHTKTGQTKVEGVVTPSDHWRTSGLLSRVCSQQDVFRQNPLWGIMDTWPNQCSWDLSIPDALCHEVLNRELFSNIPYLLPVLETVFFPSLPKINDHR